MDDDGGYYNYFPISDDVPDYGEIIALDPFVVTETRGGGDGDGSIDDGATFPNDFIFDDSGAFPISDGDDTLGGWWDSFVGGVASAFTGKPGAPTKPGASSGASSGGSSSGGKSSSTSTNKTTTSSVFSDTGISPLVLFGMGALLLAAVYVGRNTK